MHVIRFFSVVLVSLVAADLWAAGQDKKGGEEEMVSLVQRVIRQCEQAEKEEARRAIAQLEADRLYTQWMAVKSVR